MWLFLLKTDKSSHFRNLSNSSEVKMKLSLDHSRAEHESETNFLRSLSSKHIDHSLILDCWSDKQDIWRLLSGEITDWENTSCCPSLCGCEAECVSQVTTNSPVKGLIRTGQQDELDGYCRDTSGWCGHFQRSVHHGNNLTRLSRHSCSHIQHTNCTLICHISVYNTHKQL